MSVLNSTRKGIEKQTGEVWKDVVGYEGYYQVSDMGWVKSLARIVPMSDGRQYHVEKKVLRAAEIQGKYRNVCLSRDKTERLVLVHRLVLETFVGPCPEGMEC